VHDERQLLVGEQFQLGDSPQYAHGHTSLRFLSGSNNPAAVVA
jgi:hypothetical protein